MSDFTAIAAVTATLQSTLQAAVQADVTGATVSTVRPAEGDNTNLPTTGVNLFLYQISHNPHWRNHDLPTRRSNGDPLRPPEAAVDLHYLFSFYGGEVALEPQRLLGSTVAFLHAQPLLTRAQIQDAVADSSRPFLAGSDLAEQVDLIRFAPLSLSLEELSRLWSIFFQVRYVLSVAFRASVVLLEQEVTPVTAPPPRTFNLTARPLRRTIIRRVVAAASEREPILAGAQLRIQGEELRADVMRVDVDGDEAAVDEVLADSLVVTPPAGLRAGAHSVQIRHGVEIGAGAEPHLVFSSNPAPFILQPSITGILVEDVRGTGPDPRSATITVSVEPSVGADQVVTLDLMTAEGVVAMAKAPPRTVDADEVVFAVEGVAAGDYVFRIRVDGAESPLETDEEGNPTGPEEPIP
jgi:Pvc16 N-terminal domain